MILTMFLFRVNQDDCMGKPCLDDDHNCYDVASECTCKEGLRLDENGKCVGEHALVISGEEPASK